MRAQIGWKPKSDDPRIASVRFRCLTPMRALQAAGLPIEIFDPRAKDSYSLVVFSKLYDPREQSLARALRRKGCRTILDLSDNHFYNPKNLPEYAAAARNLRAMIGCVDRVICCSEELARVVVQEAAPRCPPLAVGDAVEDFDIERRAVSDDLFRILWFGSHGSPNAPAGMEDILRIRSHIEAAGRDRATELVVVSNNAAKFESLRRAMDAPARYVEWAHDAFAAELRRANLVVVPVTSNPFTLCKSNNRVATALWHGVPVFADRIPAYDELGAFACLDDWERGFREAFANEPDLAQRTEAGKNFVRTRFNDAAIAAQWRVAIESVIAQAPIP